MDIEKIYYKAYLLVDPSEKDFIEKKFFDVVKSVDRIMEVDTSQIKSYEITSEVFSPMRDDSIMESIDREVAFANVKTREYGYFKLNNILED